ncbi:Uncharacterized protein BP5553_03654 [Venustampulla echinocandica]|uniref:Uncharacterized protein n=1 Tax=Venustampulla echinocandica TaxID=2656787 RepID=A0A370TUW1_9HELO|nr:Uncharacterized protein BP5553_03654 [Venustampulla echinocandica]RDL39314.1 Uncharacterized protein BP5553_03654 [Venustampulla echinocandica]
MRVSRRLLLALGALAVTSSIAMVTFDIVFAITLTKDDPKTNTRIAAIVASALGGISVLFLLMLLIRQTRYRNGAHVQDFGHGRQHTYLLAGFSGTLGIASAVASALLLSMMRNRIGSIPKRTIASSTERLVSGGFGVWAVALLSQALFVICLVIIQRKDFQQQIQPYRVESEGEKFPQVQGLAGPQSENTHPNTGHRGQSSMESKNASSPSVRSRAGSDTISSFRSSLSHVVRPITSKTRLIQTGYKSPHRPTSIDSGPRDSSTEDSFDSWDTSTVDAQSRQAVESASPIPQRFLETIPASPTGSRSPSPGFPLDLEPPKTRNRSRSYSPSSNHREIFRHSRTASPAGSMTEAHIHPLFRTDSPTPPPSTTPGTVVTAAPNAGQLISDRQSIRTIHRMRSGSLPASPLAHSDSFDSASSIDPATNGEELERKTANGERTLTPPIPDFILNGGPRNSLSGYNLRKKTLAGLGIVGETGEM